MLPQLDEEDKTWLRRETSHRWDQPRTLYGLVVLCSMAAAVQGMDESVVNGAQLFFPDQFGISTNNTIAGSASKAENNQWLLGLVTGAPYVSCFSRTHTHSLLFLFCIESRWLVRVLGRSLDSNPVTWLAPPFDSPLTRTTFISSKIRSDESLKNRSK